MTNGQLCPDDEITSQSTRVIMDYNENYREKF